MAAGFIEMISPVVAAARLIFAAVAHFKVAMKRLKIKEKVGEENASRLYSQKIARLPRRNTSHRADFAILLTMLYRRDADDVAVCRLRDTQHALSFSRRRMMSIAGQYLLYAAEARFSEGLDYRQSARETPMARKRRITWRKSNQPLAHPKAAAPVAAANAAYQNHDNGIPRIVAI